MATAARTRGDGAETADDDADAGPYICEDILVGILHRLPARSAVRCAALSKRHQALLATSKFWDAHGRLAAPLPLPHVAYLATVRPDGDADATSQHPERAVLPLPDCAFHDFRLAGSGLRSGTFLDAKTTERYVGTCHGVVLLAARASIRGVLFNPAVAGDGGEQAVRFRCPDDHRAGNNKARRPRKEARFRISGFGYGPSSGAYKLVVSREEASSDPILMNFRTTELLVCTLGRPGERPRTVLSGLHGRICGASLYADGTVYLLDVDTPAVLAFDVDGEAVSSVALPGRRRGDEVAEDDMLELNPPHAVSRLMEVSGRACVATADGPDRTAFWLLTPDRRWEQRFAIDLSLYSVHGAWDCGGGALMLLSTQSRGRICTVISLCDGSSRALAGYEAPRPLTLKKQGYALCWGYRPTLVSPGSIVGAGSHVVRQGRGGLYAVVEPVIELHKERAREQTLHVNCVMELLHQAMGTVPEEREEVISQIIFSSGIESI